MCSSVKTSPLDFVSFTLLVIEIRQSTTCERSLEQKFSHILIFCLPFIKLSREWDFISQMSRRHLHVLYDCEYQISKRICRLAICLCIVIFPQIRESLNSSVSPCSDLWRWACGGWLFNHELPAGRSIWNQRHQLMREGL